MSSEEDNKEDEHELPSTGTEREVSQEHKKARRGPVKEEPQKKQEIEFVHEAPKEITYTDATESTGKRKRKKKHRK